jgi:hypothetical protein|tara:strand:- start:3158 stop:3664 length:507 start_codon:yes stop_codon:yes gene_type:complete
MAIFIFAKNSNDQTGALCNIVESQTVLDNNWNGDPSNYDMVTVSDELFNSVRLQEKEVVSKNGDTVNTIDTSVAFTFRSGLTQDINVRINQMDNWLKINSSKPLASSVTTYKNFIAGIDVNSLITDPSPDATFDETTGLYSDGTPLNSSLEKYVEDQGVTAVNGSQLL